LGIIVGCTFTYFDTSSKSIEATKPDEKTSKKEDLNFNFFLNLFTNLISNVFTIIFFFAVYLYDMKRINNKVA